MSIELSTPHVQLRIAIIMRDFSNVSGSKVYLEKVTRTLRKMGHEVIVICMAPVHPDLDLNAEVIPSCDGHINRSAALACHLEKLHLDNNFDIVMGCYIHGALASYLFHLAYDIPYVILLHGVEFLKAKSSRWKRAFLQPAINNASCILTTGRHFPSKLQSVLNVPLPPIVHLPLAVDMQLINSMLNINYSIHNELNINKNEKVVLFVGGIYPIKGPQILLDSMVNLTELGQSVHAVFVGEGDYRADLMSLSEKYQLQNRVHWIGFRPNVEIPTIMSSADVVIVPSTSSEATGNFVILEAMSVGVPVIASSVDDIPGLITNNENGILVTPSDSKILAEKIIYLLSNPDLYRKISIGGMECANQHTWKACATRLLDTCYQVINTGGKND